MTYLSAKLRILMLIRISLLNHFAAGIRHETD